MDAGDVVDVIDPGRRARQHELGVFAELLRMGVMAGVVVAEIGRRPDDQNAGDPVHGFVEPTRPEGRPVAGFVHRREQMSQYDAMQEHGRDQPARSRRQIDQGAGAEDDRHVSAEIHQTVTVGPFGEGLQLLARDDRALRLEQFGVGVDTGQLIRLGSRLDVCRCHDGEPCGGWLCSDRPKRIGDGIFRQANIVYDLHQFILT